jgi:predicted transcriptional regulator
MKQRKLDVHIGASESAALDDMGQRFIRAWKSAKPSSTLQDHVTFMSLEAFQSALSPRRLELIRFLRQHEPMSVRKLSQLLERDYKSVHREVAMLINAGLIERNHTDLITVTWDSAMTEIDLAA